MEVPPQAEKAVAVDIEVAQEGLIETTVALAEEASGEMTMDGCDEIERLLLQAASDLAKCRVGLKLAV